MLKYVLVAVLILASTSRTQAQISVRNSLLGKALIVSSDAPPGPEVAKIGMNVVDVEATFPLLTRANPRTEARTVLEHKLGLRHQYFTYQWPAGDTEYKPDQVYGISNGLSLYQTHGQKWSSISFATIGAYSDMEDVSGKDLLAEGGILIMRKFGEHWLLGGGPVFTYAFGDPLLIPAPYLHYKGGGKIYLDVRVPKHASIGMQVTPNFRAGLALRSLFNNYRLGDPRARNTDGKSVSIVFSDVTLGAEASLGGRLRLDFGAGTTLDRKLDINDHRGKKILSRGLKNTWMISAGLSYSGAP